MNDGRRGLWGSLVTNSILPQPPHLCQNGSFSVLSSIGETENSRVGRGESHVVFGQKFPGEKRKCEMVPCRNATAGSLVVKVRGEAIARFHAVAVKRHSSMRNWLFDLPGRILCEQSFWCQRKWWACSWLSSSPVWLFPVSVSLHFPHTAQAFFPERLFNHSLGPRHMFSDICTQFDAVSLPDPLRNLIRPDTRFQIKGCKKSACPPSWVKFCTLTPKIC
jgi:hypothetical protein